MTISHAIVVRPHVDTADPTAGDDAVRRLVKDLREGRVEVLAGGASQPGHKGTMTSLVITLATPSMTAAAVRAFHLWLRRDRYRSLVLTRTGDDGQTEVRIEGQNISEQAVRDAVRQALEGGD